MNTKLASPKALAVIDQYLHFRVHCATASVPYYNNSRMVVRAGLRGAIGKGSPRDIFDEAEIAMAREKNASGTNADVSTTGETFKHFLVDHNLGIDCSGLVYYVVNAEMQARGKGSIDRHLKFPYPKGIFGKIRAKMRPAENAGVATFAHEKNSRAIALKDVEPGDIITMVSNGDNPADGDKERDHILFIHQVDYQNFTPTVIHYTHSVAWPSDGKYGHGVRQGDIEILDPIQPLTKQKWTEAEKTGEDDGTGTENYTFVRALKARTEIRRMVSW